MRSFECCERGDRDSPTVCFSICETFCTLYTLNVYSGACVVLRRELGPLSTGMVERFQRRHQHLHIEHGHLPSESLEDAADVGEDDDGQDVLPRTSNASGASTKSQ